MKKTVAVYDYRDEAGVLLYQKVRFAPKAFSQRRPDGQGGWLSNLTGTRRVLYRLDELKGREAVVLCEGEADADRLRSLGIPATTTPDGAKTQPGKNWRPEYTEQLVAAGVQRLVVIPDNDQAGQVYVGDAATACHAADIAVRVVTLRDVPPKGDGSMTTRDPTCSPCCSLLKLTSLTLLAMSLVVKVVLAMLRGTDAPSTRPSYRSGD